MRNARDYEHELDPINVKKNTATQLEPKLALIRLREGANQSIIFAVVDAIPA